VNVIITNDLVETFLKCPTKCFLRSCGEAGTRNAYAAWVRTKNDVFRIEGTKRSVAEVAPDKCAIGTPAGGVGIGTTQPFGKLDVAGDAVVRARLFFGTHLILT
jgi:hypothetical protein